MKRHFATELRRFSPYFTLAGKKECSTIKPWQAGEGEDAQAVLTTRGDWWSRSSSPSPHTSGNKCSCGNSIQWQKGYTSLGRYYNVTLLRQGLLESRPPVSGAPPCQVPRLQARATNEATHTSLLLLSFLARKSTFQSANLEGIQIVKTGGWPEICSYPPVSASPVLRLQMSITTA